MCIRDRQWIDLRAACLVGHASEVDDPDLAEAVSAALDEKYSSYRRSRGPMPDAVKKHYSRKDVIIAFDADRRTISWYNRKIRAS